MDILGKPINNAVGLAMWSREKTATHIGAIQFVIDPIRDKVETGFSESQIVGNKQFRLYEVVGLK